MHFNTWPPIEVDIDGFKAKVEKEHGIDVEIMDPGQTFTL
jgi:L-ascorbate metabolism protein UlaG (beta-lactamase superfamily)